MLGAGVGLSAKAGIDPGRSLERVGLCAADRRSEDERPFWLRHCLTGPPVVGGRVSLVASFRGVRSRPMLSSIAPSAAAAYAARSPVDPFEQHRKLRGQRREGRQWLRHGSARRLATRMSVTPAASRHRAPEGTGIPTRAPTALAGSAPARRGRRPLKRQAVPVGRHHLRRARWTRSCLSVGRGRDTCFLDPFRGQESRSCGARLPVGRSLQGDPSEPRWEHGGCPADRSDQVQGCRSAVCREVQVTVSVIAGDRTRSAPETRARAGRAGRRRRSHDPVQPGSAPSAPDLFAPAGGADALELLPFNRTVRRVGGRA